MTHSSRETVSDYTLVFSKKAFSAADIQQLIVDLEEGKFIDKAGYTDKRKKYLIECLKQDIEILDSNTKICKGGNWGDNLIYCLTSSRHTYKASEASSKIGFK